MIGFCCWKLGSHWQCLLGAGRIIDEEFGYRVRDSGLWAVHVIPHRNFFFEDSAWLLDTSIAGRAMWVVQLIEEFSFLCAARC